MMLLVSGSTRSVARMANSYPLRLGHLLTPANRNSVQSIVSTGMAWAVDNGAFAGFDAMRFRSLVKRVAGQKGLLWVVCPDVVADAQRTLELFDLWRYELIESAVPLAFVGQDGLEDYEVPWGGFSCFFIGGSTRWKLSQAAADLAHEAKARSKLVHMGRVNSRRRIVIAHDLGCDSIDGSSASMFGDKYIHKYLQWISQLERQPLLT
jgi:hypothetical protein